MENSYQQNYVSIAMSTELSASLQLPTPHNKMMLSNVGADGSLEKFKARLVAQGYSQIEGFDVQETFALTTRMTTI